uniref:Lysozyme-like protein n=1 Tax=Myoviridae sp. ctj3P51 TaxID=2826687 RepID=A0A8S5NQG0_9CAUD|nr:MAG TPA: lysozyme-like protein [Myoviridae sp. ctj3P51]
MKCRALSKDGHIIWFGKDFSNKNYMKMLFYVLDTGHGYYLDIPQGNTFSLFGKTFVLDYNLGNDHTATVYYEGNEKIIAGYATLVTETFVSNYVSDTDAVVASLNQRLSVIKGELWYQVNYGLPLMDKQRGTNVLDLVLADIITSHPGVASLDSYSSRTVDHIYYYDCKITSVYGESVAISNNLTI